jgi:ketosteroid isomerase-like protein
MCRISYLVCVAAAFLTACSSGPRPDLNGEHPEKVAAIKSRIGDIFDAAEHKDWKRLDAYHLYGPNFTKFGSERPERQDASQTRALERAGLETVEDLSMQSRDLKIDVFGDAAVATFILDYSLRVGSDAVAKQSRATIVFVEDLGSWRIVHEHFSPLEPSR